LLCCRFALVRKLEPIGGKKTFLPKEEKNSSNRRKISSAGDFFLPMRGKNFSSNRGENISFYANTGFFSFDRGKPFSSCRVKLFFQ